VDSGAVVELVDLLEQLSFSDVFGKFDELAVDVGLSYVCQLYAIVQ
jgi:hypothetical protein